MPEVPEGGLCLSAFVLISAEGEPWTVLMDHLNPDAPWDHLGALDGNRALVHSKGWMLPSSHLMVKEAPAEAAERIVREQLEMEGLRLSGPQVVSEVYRPRRFPEKSDHWDLEFIFRSSVDKEKVPHAKAWSDLRFVDTRVVELAEIARSHEDILESAGFRLRP
jgi:hypothetical protein